MTEQTMHIPAPIADALDKAAHFHQRAHDAAVQRNQINNQIGDLSSLAEDLKRQQHDLEVRLGEVRERIAQHTTVEHAKRIEEGDLADQAAMYWRMAQREAAELGIDISAVTPNGTGPLPVVSTGPQRALPSGVEVATADQIRERFHLQRGEQRPVLPDGDTLTTRADTPLPAPPGGEAPEAPFHPGDPDSDDTGRSDA